MRLLAPPRPEVAAWRLPQPRLLPPLTGLGVGLEAAALLPIVAECGCWGPALTLDV